MKKVFIIFGMTIISSMIIFNGCTKENEVLTEKLSSSTLTKEEQSFLDNIKIEADKVKNNQNKFIVNPDNPNNPYDYVGGVYLVNFLKYMNSTQEKYDSSFTYEQYKANMNTYINLNPTPQLDVNEDLTNIEFFILKFNKECFLNINTNLYVLISKITETLVANSSILAEFQKKRILFTISYQKHFRYYYTNTGLTINGQTTKADWSDEMYDCMHTQLGNIFNDDNYVDDAIYIAGMPASLLGTVAYCLAETMIVQG